VKSFLLTAGVLFSSGVVFLSWVLAKAAKMADEHAERLWRQMPRK